MFKQESLVNGSILLIIFIGEEKNIAAVYNNSKQRGTSMYEAQKKEKEKKIRFEFVQINVFFLFCMALSFRKVD